MKQKQLEMLDSINMLYNLSYALVITSFISFINNEEWGLMILSLGVFTALLLMDRRIFQ